MKSLRGRSLPLPLSSSSAKVSFPHSSRSRNHPVAGGTARVARIYILLLSLAFIALPTVSATLVSSPSDPFSISTTRQTDSREIVSDNREESPQEHYYTPLYHRNEVEDEEHDSDDDDDEPTSHTLSPRSDDWTFPRAFDTSLSSYFNAPSCRQFFDTFLNDPTFQSCHAISPLLQDSTEFFHTLRSTAETSRTLDTACAAPVSTCATIMTNFAKLLRNPSNCAQDFNLGNPLVRSAYKDLIAYEPVYKATCLTNPETNGYCFVDAVFSNNSADYNLYFLPLGGRLVRGENVTCSKCLQATMSIFANWAGVPGQPLAGSYIPSAITVDRNCGKGFVDVNVTVALPETSAATSVMVGGLSLGLLTAGLAVAVAGLLGVV